MKKDLYVIVKLRDNQNVGIGQKRDFHSIQVQAYMKLNSITEEYLDGKLFLEAECGEDVLEIIINDNKPLIAPWHPYRFDISEQVQSGKNKIQIKSNKYLNKYS
jgi:hypothetical protein